MSDAPAAEPTVEPTVEQLSSENESLKNQLAADNAALRQQIADTAQQASGGMTDEHVRRAEHPEEFADGDKAETPAEADDDPAGTAPVAPALTTGPTSTGTLPAGYGFAVTPAGTPPTTSAAAATPAAADTPAAPQEPAQAGAGASPPLTPDEARPLTPDEARGLLEQLEEEQAGRLRKFLFDNGAPS